jgi:hypothetical protein
MSPPDPNRNLAAIPQSRTTPPPKPPLGSSGSFSMKLLCVLLLIVTTGCTDSSIIPIAGYWTGQFNAKPADPKVKMRPEWVYKGYLQLYATGMKYKMHMESVAQIVDVSGTWQKKKDKIYLTSNLVEFDDKGGDLQRPTGVKPLDPQVVRQAYSQVMGFNYDAAKHELDGLDMSMGPLIGTHVFIKGGE